MSQLTRALAQYVASPTFGDAQSEAFRIAKLGFVDTVGTMFAGCDEPVVKIVLKHLENRNESQDAPVPLAGLLKPSMVAACINATAGHALDYDDVAMAGHPSTVLVPAILAESHRLGRTGHEALVAYVVGYEVWSELVFRDPGKYHLKGWHPTGVLGTVAAAAAVASLNRLDVDQTSTSLAIAASMASGLVANFGTMTKPLHAGRAASNAIEAVQLAMLGLTAAPDAFEHKAGYLAALSPAGDVDRDSSPSRLGGRPRILETGLSIKRYPVCYSCHRSIDGAVKLVQEHDLKPSDVKSVTVTIGPAQASMLRNHTPRTGLEAKFSIEFAMASALVAREVGLRQLTDAFVLEPEVQAQFEKVRTEINNKPCPLEPTFSYTDRVVMHLHDGRTLDSGDIRFPLGNAENPMDEAGMRSKFLDCLASGRALGAVTKCDDETLYERLANLETQGDLKALFEA
ncbi:MmgE/PrpD family protein [Orrella marina]|uniref:MmgE/PrpD family protein n=1 Tax=Orrella marina TaxID=2163011 RepID=A0A2R4XKW8_9BURK|nr:MmgE/PrpD family protein [Orrella marina]AWB34452.1 MmgE/PrpD family protein [Orrella marina]